MMTTEKRDAPTAFQTLLWTLCDLQCVFAQMPGVTLSPGLMGDSDDPEGATIEVWADYPRQEHRPGLKVLDRSPLMMLVIPPRDKVWGGQEVLGENHPDREDHAVLMFNVDAGVPDHIMWALMGIAHTHDLVWEELCDERVDETK